MEAEDQLPRLGLNLPCMTRMLNKEGHTVTVYGRKGLVGWFSERRAGRKKASRARLRN